MLKKKYYKLIKPKWQSSDDKFLLTKYCEWPECNAKGEFPAPTSREELRKFKWLCLHHVKKYNNSWNYFKGQSREQIEKEIAKDATWHRPTWKTSQNKIENIRDNYNLFEASSKSKVNILDNEKITGEIKSALKIFNLDKNTTINEIKKSYKLLVKKFHPDANSGNKIYMDKLIQVNNAYNLLLVTYET